MNKALFLDRDGVININHGYVSKSQDFDFIEGIFDLVKRANLQGYKVIIVTNQSGIGRGMYTEADFDVLTQWMANEFTTHGAIIDDVLFCPHHPEAKLEQYKATCACRKPQAGMLFDAAVKHEIALSDSLMVGDKLSDIQAAVAAGLNAAVWFNPEFIEPNKLRASQVKIQALQATKTAIHLSHSLATILKD